MLRQCRLCGREFKAKVHNAVFCSDPHYKDCEWCGETFQIKSNKEPAKACSKKCSTQLSIKNRYNIPKVCEWKSCRKEFLADKESTRFCDSDHYEECEVCGDRFKIANIHIPATTCSKVCAAAITDFDERNKKSVATNLKKYGVKNPSQSEEVKRKKEETTLKNYGVVNPFNIPEVKIRAVQNNGLTISKINLRWQELLKEEFGVEFELEVPFGESYADLGYEDLLIDINPTFTHSSTISFVHLTNRCTDEGCTKESHRPRDERYHQLRALEAEENGYTLLQFFDWMNEGKFLNMVRTKLRKNQRRITAKKTVIKEITQREANKFFEENHLFGGSNMQRVCIGLFYEDELVHCHTYGPARFNKNFEWEAIRSATKANTFIPGGFSKLDKYFFDTHNPESIVSYVDLSFSTGETELLFDGWEVLRVNRPSSTWVNLYSNENPPFIRSGTARRLSADRLLGFEVGEKYPRFDESGEKITNEDVLMSEGYIEVFDAGTKTIGWRRDRI